MPHLVIEYTNNLRDRFDARVALAELNRELDAVGEFVSEDIKSRARALDTFLVGVNETLNRTTAPALTDAFVRALAG